MSQFKFIICIIISCLYLGLDLTDSGLYLGNLWLVAAVYFMGDKS